MINYESVVIFYPDTDEDTREEVINRLADIVSEGGEVEIDHWGDKKFAYPIEFHNHGNYYLLTFKADNESLAEFSRIAKIQESILRFMIVNLDK